jgi:hypothetical protein
MCIVLLLMLRITVYSKHCRPPYGLVLALDRNGNIVKSLHDPTGKFFFCNFMQCLYALINIRMSLLFTDMIGPGVKGWISEAEYHDGFLYTGSFRQPYLGRLRYDDH